MKARDYTKPHLALLAGADGSVIPIPEGATMFIVLDATRSDKVFPFIVSNITARGWDGICACGNPDCNLVRKFRFTTKGFHPLKYMKDEDASHKP